MENLECNYNEKTNDLIIKLFKPFEKVEKTSLTPFMEELDSKPHVHHALVKMGCKNQIEELRQYIICLYGGNDDKPDFENGKLNPDYSHCGRRGKCPAEGTPGLCSLPIINGKVIPPVELKTMHEICKESSVKMIAATRGRSEHTVTRQVKNLREKTNSFTQVGVALKAVIKGIVNVSTL